MLPAHCPPAGPSALRNPHSVQKQNNVCANEKCACGAHAHSHPPCRSGRRHRTAGPLPSRRRCRCPISVLLFCTRRVARRRLLPCGRAGRRLRRAQWRQGRAVRARSAGWAGTATNTSRKLKRTGEREKEGEGYEVGRTSGE